MKKLGRPRNSKNIPADINADKLPDRVWFKAEGNGSWMLSYYDENGKRKHQRLCGPEASISEIWQAFEAKKQKKATTFITLSIEFQSSPAWRALSSLTQKDYLFCHQAITQRKTSTGTLLGDIPINSWTVGTVRKYRDKRAEESKSRAIKEMAYLMRVFNWAYEYEKITFNPAAGVKKPSLPARQHYAEDKDYYFLLNIAKQSGYWYAPDAMELAYLCGMRLSEVLDMTDANETEAGLVIKRRKGSKTTIVEWQPRLAETWNTLKKTRNAILADSKQPHPIHADKRYLFISARTGNKIAENSLKTAMSRIKATARKEAEKTGREFIDFTFHDIKRKSVSDATGNKQDFSGHRSAAMMNVYDVKPNIVKPVKKD
ncbi:MAG: tyrosine-type recombinase/integrase [Methylobacter sp.]|uniref:site-specific integrase n=1 Tax=Methylobacter sp. TaxID=2051955 RepID=UPI0025D5FDD9|nr:tyrosine-type recombinase/integrase [Methylobacter sp.]MCK9622206.1 tyrosine-type recombinase/integrase [Methylobacter sp.]